MKKLILLFIMLVNFDYAKSNPISHDELYSKFSFNLGGGYVNWAGLENGFIAFSEFQYHFTSRLSAGTNFYYAKTRYPFDSNTLAHFTGVDLNAYFTFFKNNHLRESIGAGYAFRFANSIYSVDYPDYVISKGATLNLLIEGDVSEHFGVGIKAAWQPFGSGNNLTYCGFFGTVKF